MTYVDPASSIRVETLLPVTNLPGVLAGTEYPPSYSGGTFTQAFDCRPYSRAVVVVPVETIGANVDLDIKFQRASSDDFSTWTDIPDSAFTTLDPDSDNQAYVCTFDLTKHQNAIGINLIVTVKSGTARARVGAYAILFPYDTTNAGYGSGITSEFDL